MATKTKKEEKQEKKETKNEKFRRLATLRVSKALHTIGLVGNLSGSGYEYTQEEVKKIFTAFQVKLQETANKFAPKEKRVEEKKEFSL